ncbi:hypothetical protein [Ruminiclostridium papyrosolvens]|uniref:hypothetical protein n=1 Tax=Ruminiclostridium papyrosolvens TaxID=29362 RepID=UPI0003F6E799
MYSIRLDGDTRRLINRMRQLKEIDKKGINDTIAEAVRGSTVERFRTEKTRTERSGRNQSGLSRKAVSLWL